MQHLLTKLVVSVMLSHLLTYMVQHQLLGLIEACTVDAQAYIAYIHLSVDMLI